MLFYTAYLSKNQGYTPKNNYLVVNKSSIQAARFDMEDGLYLNNTWVAEVECALTIQANDLTKPDSLEASYSNTFELPDSLLIRDLLQNAEQLDAGGPDPYRQLPAKLYQEGELVFSGIVELVDFQGGWKVNLLDSMVSFFDSIKDKKLSDLDLSRFDHPWTFASMERLAGATKGTVYPVLDYGGNDGPIIPYDTMTPAFYCKTLVLQIIQEAGYRPTGAWLDDELFNKMALPFVEDRPKSHSDEWRNDRTAYVTANKTDNLVLKSGHPIDEVLPLNFDNLPQDGYEDGAKDCYKAEHAYYDCPEAMYLNVQASVLFFSKADYGAPEIRLIIMRNGQNAAEAYWSKAGPYDHLDEPGDSLSIDETIQCQAGDQISIRLTGNSRTNFSSYALYFSQAIGDMTASFVPDTTIHFGDKWLTASNLPEMSCADVMLSIAKIMCGSYSADAFRKTVSLVTLSEIINNLPGAKDWSSKVEETEEPTHTPSIEGYAQRNLCQWKELDEKETRRDKVTHLGYGDGLIECPNQRMSSEPSVLFELAFAACADSLSVLPGYGNPVLIRTRIVKGLGDNKTIETQSTAPRIILIEPTKTFVATTQLLQPEGNFIAQNVTLTACWWGIRSATAKTTTNAYCLAFSRLPTSREQNLIDRYFTGLKRVLRRPRTLTTSICLDPQDVAGINLAIPIRLKQVRIGSLDINDNYFYLNQVKGYQNGIPAQVVLIAIM